MHNQAQNSNRDPRSRFQSESGEENDWQISELQTFADCDGHEVVALCEEQASGNAEAFDCQGIQWVEEMAWTEILKQVMFHEVCRLARRNGITHGFIETLRTLSFSPYSDSQGNEILLPNGQRNPAAGSMFPLVAEMARVQSATPFDRVKSGLDEACREGASGEDPQVVRIQTWQVDPRG